MHATVRAAFVVLVACGTLAGAGCVYRPTIQQGNLLKVEDVDQVTAGMTRSQVRYLLGTPMLADPFDPQRWDYIYTLKRGSERKPERAHFVVRFEGDKVSRVEKLDLPEPAPVDRRTKKKHRKLEAKQEAEPARSAPATSTMPDQPQPRTTTPGSG